MEIKLKPEDVEKISGLESGNQKRSVGLLKVWLILQNTDCSCVIFHPRSYSRWVLPAVAFDWKIDVFGTPEEKGLPKVLIA